MCPGLICVSEDKHLLSPHPHPGCHRRSPVNWERVPPPHVRTLLHSFENKTSIVTQICSAPFWNNKLPQKCHVGLAFCFVYLERSVLLFPWKAAPPPSSRKMIFFLYNIRNPLKMNGFELLPQTICMVPGTGGNVEMSEVEVGGDPRALPRLTRGQQSAR